jgi:hypothetical protein
MSRVAFGGPTIPHPVERVQHHRPTPTRLVCYNIALDVQPNQDISVTNQG